MSYQYIGMVGRRGRCTKIRNQMAHFLARQQPPDKADLFPSMQISDLLLPLQLPQQIELETLPHIWSHLGKMREDGCENAFRFLGEFVP